MMLLCHKKYEFFTFWPFFLCYTRIPGDAWYVAETTLTPIVCPNTDRERLMIRAIRRNCENIL